MWTGNCGPVARNDDPGDLGGAGDLGRPGGLGRRGRGWHLVECVCGLGYLTEGSLWKDPTNSSISG